jgi:hypothetical protein
MLLGGACIYYCEDISFGEFSEDFSACLLAIEKYFARVISAHYDNAEIWRVEMDVDVEQEFLRDARDTNWRPSFSIFHRGICIYVIEKHSYIFKNNDIYF